MKEKPKSRWPLLLFSLPFAGTGIGILLLSVIPCLYEWQQMKSWPEVRARLLDANLHTSSDGDTFRATARYQYVYRGVEYTSERVAIMSGSDNIGEFQQQLAGRLEQAFRNHQPVTAWVNPDNPADAVLNRAMRWNLLGFNMIFVLVFGGVGITLFTSALISKPGTISHPDSSVKPWLGQQPWASPVITCDGRSNMWGIWGFSLLWNVISLPASTAIPGELAKGNTAILIVLLFPVAGIFLLARAIKSTLSWRRFGQLQLTLDPYPGSIGGQVGGTINLPLPYNSQQRFAVTLLCLRSYERGSGKNRRREETVIWQAEGLAHSQPGADGTRLGIRFDVPPDLPVSEPFANDYRLWRLQLKAALPGIDLNRNFEIPVFATGQQTSAPLPCSSQHPLLKDEQEAQIEAIANIEQIPGGVRLYFPMLRNPGNELIGLIFGAGFGATGIILLNHDNVPAFMAWIFTLIGGLAFFACLKSLFTSLMVQLDQSGLTCKRLWLGVIIGKDIIPRAEITKLQLDSSYSARGADGYTEIYNLHALTRNGKKIRIAMNLKGRDTAQMALEAIGSLSGYNIK